MRLIITGGRNYVLSPKGIAKLDFLHSEYIFTLLVHGNCRGIDKSVKAWAHSKGIDDKPFDVQWYVNGKLDRSQGPKRNEKMCKWFAETGGGLMIVFKGGDGTANCKENALDNNIPVLDLSKGDYVVKINK